MTNSNLAFLAKSDCKDSIMSDVKPEPVPPPYACETIKPYIDKMQVHVYIKAVVEGLATI